MKTEITYEGEAYSREHSGKDANWCLWESHAGTISQVKKWAKSIKARHPNDTIKLFKITTKFERISC